MKNVIDTYLADNFGCIIISMMLCFLSYAIGFGRGYIKAMKYCTEQLDK